MSQSQQAAHQDRVGGHGAQDKKTENGLAPELGDKLPAHEAGIDEIDQYGAQQRAQDGSRAAEDVHSADHDGSHRFQLKAEPGDHSDVAEAGQEEEAGEIVERFMAELDVDEDVAAVLVEEGFTSLEEVAYVPKEEMMAIEGFDEDVVDELRRRAKDALLTKALVSEEKLEGEQAPAEDLLNMDGMDTTTAYALAKVGIITMDDLAEQAVDELMVVDGMDEERAAQLIMTARAPWFEDQE